MPRVKITIVLLFISILGTAFLSIWLRNEIIRIGYETESFQEEKKQLFKHQKELIALVEQLRSLDQVEEIAMEQLGMKQPDFEQKVYISAREMKRESSEQDSANPTLSKYRPKR